MLARSWGSDKTFALSRFGKVAVTGKRFKRPAGFDWREFSREAFGIAHGEKPERIRLLYDPGGVARGSPTRPLVPTPDFARRSAAAQTWIGTAPRYASKKSARHLIRIALQLHRDKEISPSCLERHFTKGTSAGIQAKYEKRIRL